MKTEQDAPATDDGGETASDVLLGKEGLRVSMSSDGKTTEHPLASCCACGQVKPLSSVVTLPYRRPTPGKGWGCLVCGLPPDGVSAMACDECTEAKAKIRWWCTGYPIDPGRAPIEDLTEPFPHDAKAHAKEDQQEAKQLADMLVSVVSTAPMDGPVQVIALCMTIGEVLSAYQLDPDEAHRLFVSLLPRYRRITGEYSPNEQRDMARRLLARVLALDVVDWPKLRATVTEAEALLRNADEVEASMPKPEPATCAAGCGTEEPRDLSGWTVVEGGLICPTCRARMPSAGASA